MLGFEFDGNPGKNTIWITGGSRTDILAKLKKWIWEGYHIKKDIPFEEFWTYIEELRNDIIFYPSC